MGRPKKEKPNRADGLYEVKITVGKKLDGSLIRKSFYSSVSKEDARKQAEEWRIAQEVSKQTGVGLISKNASFQQWAVEWLNTYKKGKVKEHTFKYTYKVNIEKYFIPFFGEAKLTDITQADIQRYFNEHSFLAESNLKRHKIILNSIFEQAVYNDLCQKNPVRNIKYSSEKEVTVKHAYTLEQSLTAQAYSKQRGLEGLAIYIMLNTGMRRSEVLGLKWEDMDYTLQTVSVKRAIVPDTILPKDGDVKSKTSFRTIPVSQDFLGHLLNFKKEQGFVLSNNPEKFQTISSFDSRYHTFMKKMVLETGLPYLSPHELRHSYGSVLREKGIDIYTISKVMGHSDISITAKIYVLVS